jgi:choloylglycine hydrolase
MCTNFKAPVAEDGTVVVGRSLDYPATLGFQLCVIPKGIQRIALADEGAAATKSWSTKHGVVGLSVSGADTAIIDGMNDAGLSAHLLYMVGGFFHAADFRGDGTDVSQIELASYLLSTCATIDEVRAALGETNVWGWNAGMPFIPPVHVLVHDRNGSAAIEFRPEGVMVIDNPTGVGTNSPYLEWHLLNLNNYVGFSAENPEGQRVRPRVGGIDIRPLGVGWGLHGLPGDYTGPSRFVRAVALLTLATTPKDAREAEMLTLHVLNTFDVPAGVVREPGPGHTTVDEVTYADTIANLTDLRYSYRALDDPAVYVIDLTQTDFTSDAPRFRDLSATGDFQPITI